MTAEEPDDWAGDLAAGKLTQERLTGLARDFAADPGLRAERVKLVAKLARDAELDHRAGQVRSAEARATVAIAIGEAMRSVMPTGGRGSFLGKLTGTGDQLSDLLDSAVSQSHLALGGLARDRGDLAGAETEYATALEAARRMRRSELATGVTMLDLGRTSHLQGRDKQAEEWLRQAHPLLVHAQGPAYVPLDMYFLGLAQAGQQRWEEAIATLVETERDYTHHNLTKGVLDARLARIDVLIRSGRIDDALGLATDTAEIAKQSALPLYMAQARWHLSRIRRAENKPREALDLVDEAIKLYEEAGDAWHRAQGFMVRAEIQQGLGMIDEADHSLDESTRIAKAMKSPFLEADCMRARANLRVSAGDVAEARRLLVEARNAYADQGREDQVRLTTTQLEKLTPAGPES